VENAVDYGGHSVIEVGFVVAGKKLSQCRSEMWNVSVIVVPQNEIDSRGPVVGEVLVAWGVEEGVGVIVRQSVVVLVECSVGYGDAKRSVMV